MSTILKLSNYQIQEIEHALSAFKGTGLGIEDVSVRNFALPTLRKELDYLAEALHETSGYFVVSGLDANRHTAGDNTIIFLGIASYIGDKRGLQDKKGNMLSHITSSKLWTVPEDQRHGIHSQKALPFHNDMGCDILALQARNSASNGGSTYLSNAELAFKYLQANEPDVVKTLTTADWPVQTSGTAACHYLARVFVSHNGRMLCSMDPKRFGPQPGTNAVGIPNLTKAQMHALDRVSAVAKQNETKLDLKTGDILFFNNFAMLHRRDSYKDNEATTRHLVRLWLRNSKLGWSIPDDMLPPWLAAYGEKQPTADRLYAIEPKREYETPKYSAGSAAFVLED